jgi:hypothetical protein
MAGEAGRENGAVRSAKTEKHPRGVPRRLLKYEKEEGNFKNEHEPRGHGEGDG